MSTDMRTLLNRVTFLFALLAFSSSLAVLASPNVEGQRKDAAKSLAREIQQAHFQKVYVADFLDASGIRNERGCFFSSVFSTLLTESGQGLTVVNRIEAQKKLDELHISAQDFQQPEILAKAATAIGADSVLTGSASISSTDARLSLSLRDAVSGEEIFGMDYQEKLESSFENSFPAGQSADGHILYFPGLDGNSQPKCIRCPNPDFSDLARRRKIQGHVLLSVRIDEKGKIKDARVVNSPDESLTRQCLDILRDWRLKPSQDINGYTVPVRTAIEMVFRLLN